jgi:anaerobic magnesium-protoporphyrin IX monomethyl ester cyclase
MSPSGTEPDRINLKTFRREISDGTGVEVLDYFYEWHADSIQRLKPLLVGLTIPFLSQLEHSAHLATRLRKLGVKVVFGGPIAAKFYKYIERSEDLAILGFAADLLVTGEGETLIGCLADRIANEKGLTGLPNLVDLGTPKPVERLHFEDVNALSAPDYSVWDYDLYASPEPGALYSPTRGCYWNKCSFCDYGLAVGGPTSPWRTRTPDRVADDLEQASQHIRYFFFAVDVLSPSYGLRLAEKLIERKIGLKWMADFRLESSFCGESAKVLREAGCVGAAFGMESGSQDIIDAMKKGTSVVRLDAVVGAFAEQHIAVQLMGFTGFPGENAVQAQRTIDTARRLSSVAATTALGKFGLTPGSDVARNPSEYGVEVLYPKSHDISIPWELQWRYTKGELDGIAEDDFSASLELMRGFPFPFLGATTTLHSLLYFAKYSHRPYPIPSWSYVAIAGEQLDVVPCFLRLCEQEGLVAIQSGLTGRVLLLDAEIANLLEQHFQNGEVRQIRSDPLDAVRPILDFMVEHSLAVFLRSVRPE